MFGVLFTFNFLRFSSLLSQKDRVLSDFVFTLINIEKLKCVESDMCDGSSNTTERTKEQRANPTKQKDEKLLFFLQRFIRTFCYSIVEWTV